VLASRKRFDTDLLPIVKKLGLTPDATYGFYNADAPATEALKDTSAAWRPFRIIFVTTHIMVAINLTLAFHSRWLFAERNADYFATVSELMQAVARAPRGVSAADRAWQMREHWVNILIDGKPPTLADCKKDQERQRGLAAAT